MDDSDPESSDSADSIKSGAVTRLLTATTPNFNPNLEKILLNPNSNPQGEFIEIATINCATTDYTIEGKKPIIYRSEVTKTNKKQFKDLTALDRFSRIMLGWFKDPHTLTNESSVILQPSGNILGLEDPDIALINNKLYISAVGYDGLNAQIHLFTTSDLKQINNKGIISPDLTLKRAIEVVGNKEYKQKWSEDYHGKLKHLVDLGDIGKNLYQNLGIFLWDKDMILSEQDNQKQEVSMIHRLIPDVHLAIGTIKDFQTNDYWEDYLAHIDKHTLLKAKSLGYDKIGMRAKAKLGDKIISLLHGLRDTENGEIYETRLCEIYDNNIVSITPTLITPSEKDIFEYQYKGQTKRKKVVFGSALLVDENNDKVYVYYNSGDRVVKIKEFSATQVYSSLNDSKNREIKKAA